MLASLLLLLSDIFFYLFLKKKYEKRHAIAAVAQLPRMVGNPYYCMTQFASFDQNEEFPGGLYISLPFFFL